MRRGERLDERLTREGLAQTRTRAQALILAGQVLVDDQPVDKPGTRVRETSVVRVRGERRFVSRGGEKLAGALDDLGIDVGGLRCLDVGASTGGFSDCLLQRGAVSVVAVDVGYGQLDGALRNDPRLSLLERTNARDLVPEQIPGPLELVTVDVSFIASRLLLPALARVAPGADWLVMVKPQFEVGRGQVGKGGVVRDAGLRQGPRTPWPLLRSSSGGRRGGGRTVGSLAPRGTWRSFSGCAPGAPMGRQALRWVR